MYLKSNLKVFDILKYISNIFYTLMPIIIILLWLLITIYHLHSLTPPSLRLQCKGSQTYVIS